MPPTCCARPLRYDQGRGAEQLEPARRGRHREESRIFVWFRILGPLEVVGASGQLSFAPRQRIVLSMLLLEPNRVVTIERLVDAVWDNKPPSTAKEQVRICV